MTKPFRKQDCWYKDVCNHTCSNSCIRYIEMKYLMDSSGIPKNLQIPRQLKACTDNNHKAFTKLSSIKNNIVNFIQRGENLYICSEQTGTAKTSWAIKLMLKYFNDIWSGNGLTVRGLFIHTPTFLLRLKDFNNPLDLEYRENIKNCDLVIWDDIATSLKMSDYDFNQLLTYIDHRLLYNKSNIYTSNITTKAALSKAVGDRIASRIYESSNVIKFDGKDGRGVKW